MESVYTLRTEVSASHAADLEALLDEQLGKQGPCMLLFYNSHDVPITPEHALQHYLTLIKKRRGKACVTYFMRCADLESATKSFTIKLHTNNHAAAEIFASSLTIAYLRRIVPASLASYFDRTTGKYLLLAPSPTHKKKLVKVQPDLFTIEQEEYSTH